mmetsp:Transcript_20991/g.20117  ORF Transcript_20991/g.20117 Transcript_20991/m.20117 type:complete len:299 (-) Transcript_20991:14-910(-)
MEDVVGVDVEVEGGLLFTVLHQERVLIRDGFSNSPDLLGRDELEPGVLVGLGEGDLDAPILLRHLVRKQRQKLLTEQVPQLDLLPIGHSFPQKHIELILVVGAFLVEQLFVLGDVGLLLDDRLVDPLVLVLVLLVLLLQVVLHLLQLLPELLVDNVVFAVEGHFDPEETLLVEVAGAHRLLRLLRDHDKLLVGHSIREHDPLVLEFWGLSELSEVEISFLLHVLAFAVALVDLLHEGQVHNVADLQVPLILLVLIVQLRQALVHRREPRLSPSLLLLNHLGGVLELPLALPESLVVHC